MNQGFDQFNDETIDLAEFEGETLTDLEKGRIKKRIQKKIRTRKMRRKVAIPAVAAVVFISALAMNSNFALADLPIIGAKLEKFVLAQQEGLTDYKTILGKTVEDQGMKVTLNEVILDEGQLLIGSTFHTNLEGSDLAYNWYTNIEVYLDGKEIALGGGGGPEEITNSHVQYFWTQEIGPLLTKKDQRVKIVFKDLKRSDDQKELEGTWSFEFMASAENLMAHTKTIPIHHQFVTADGQKVEVDELILTPVSTKLSYIVNDPTEDEIYFKIEDDKGKELQAFFGSIGTKENYNRFIAIADDVQKIKLTPFINMEKGEMVMEDKSFEVDLKK
ncbi:DUF4179 domain-containing protein [Bacillus niameyensis]|uniref:DUF4179 domain-containing protein n=1 Tax=Bacillus niameyensis TaxID=1522308 RepID=UPI000781A2C0|nr:DUF4179 domain-containing protein [Bacillus niameyensis]